MQGFSIGIVNYSKRSTPILSTMTSSVDNPIHITFVDDPLWRSLIIGIKITNFTPNVSIPIGWTATAGLITIDPSIASQIRIPGFYTISVIAGGYMDAPVSLNLLAGAVSNLIITRQPSSPVTNGGLLSTQPLVKLTDKYGNAEPGYNVVASPVGSWSLGGTATQSTISGSPAGTAIFNNLTSTRGGSPITGAQIVFTVSGSPSIIATSSLFNIP